MSQRKNKKIYYHLPGLFEFYELYCVFLPLYKEHREYFYDWCEISSIYGSPADCLEGTEKHTIFILTLIKKKKSIRVFMILVDFLLDKI